MADDQVPSKGVGTQAAKEEPVIPLLYPATVTLSASPSHIMSPPMPLQHFLSGYHPSSEWEEIGGHLMEVLS